MSAPTPFHLAFAVTDIDATREFYVNKLGCKMGRSAERWTDFDFFGIISKCVDDRRLGTGQAAAGASACRGGWA